VYSRLRSELDAAKSRVSERDRDLQSVQNVLRGLEDERQKLGDEHTSDRFSLELEIERVKRDLQRAEVDLDQARKDLTKRDLDVAQMVSSR
jgi:septal ring factor EnvC (AmiA/AmiB activator)